jgi:hypothetical protein
MSDNENWLLETIVAKSDQLNAVDLIGGPITVTVKSVTKGEQDQPVIIGIGERQPYKPCKSMRRVLIACWGANPSVWIGRKMTLFCDPNVKWGGESVGGIRISHLSHLKLNKQEVQLNESKHKKITYIVFQLSEANDERLTKAIDAIGKATDAADVARVWKLCEPLYKTCSEDHRLRLEQARDQKTEAVQSE